MRLESANIYLSLFFFPLYFVVLFCFVTSSLSAGKKNTNEIYTSHYVSFFSLGFFQDEKKKFLRTYKYVILNVYKERKFSNYKSKFFWFMSEWYLITIHKWVRFLVRWWNRHTLEEIVSSCSWNWHGHCSAFIVHYFWKNNE